MNRTDGNDAGGIDVVVSDVIVAFDMVEVHGLGDAVGLIEVFEIAEQVGVVDDPPDVALKVTVVDGVEPNQRDEQTPVGFDESRTEEVSMIGELFFQLVERVKQPQHGLLVYPL